MYVLERRKEMIHIEGTQMMMTDVAEIIQKHHEEQYQAFTDKFKTAKTTDDCYTPQNIYDCLADWVAEEYGYDRDKFLRPFKPSGDYQAEEYPYGWAVVDNPPFSILSQILDWYLARDIPFFLFGPTLTLLQNMRRERKDRCCVILIGNNITYENGAKVNTSYITNMEKEYAVRIEHELREKLEAENKENERALHKELPAYTYPDHVLTGGAYVLASHGQTLRIRKKDCFFINGMDAQKKKGKSIFGAGLLLSDTAAAERAAAERAAAERAAAERAAAERAAEQKKKAHIWELSPRELEIIKGLGESK